MDSSSLAVFAPNWVVQLYGEARNDKTVPQIIGLNSIDEVGQKRKLDTMLFFCELINHATSLHKLLCREFETF